jgi:deoxyadenosine/deoxycytidine kinase
MVIVSVEGNIGSGKSTLMERLKSSLPSEFFVFIDEPVDVWMSIKDENGADLLTNFYKDPSKFAFQFQMTAYISIVDLLKKAVKNNPGKIIIIERCTHTARNVFAKMLTDTGKMTKMEFKIYDMWYDSFLDDIRDIKFVYLKTDAKVCHERILKRARPGEDKIELGYLKMCDEYHNNWLNNNDKVVKLDGNTNFEKDKSIVDNWIKEILKLCHPEDQKKHRRQHNDQNLDYLVFLPPEDHRIHRHQQRRPYLRFSEPFQEL